MMLTNMEELAQMLEQAQKCHASRISCELSPAFSARMNDAALVEALITGLPMAQGISHRILRSRGRGVILTAKLRYRQGVRMLSGIGLTQEESAALDMAQAVVAEAPRQNDAARFEHVYGWVCANVRYVNTFPGQKGYERLVGAAGVLMDRQANCQGFADVLYLLCGMCGIPCEYRCGRGQRQLHVWNAVCLEGIWQDVDASKGARRPLSQQS